MLHSLFYWILDTLLPPRHTEATVLGLSVAQLESIRTDEGLPYRDKRVRALVWELKYRGSARALALAGEFLAGELLGIASEEIGKPLLVPIPMHSARREERGHNQTELLCKAALSYLEDTLEYAPQVLTRVRHTPPQQTLPRHKRLTNVKNSMEVVDGAKVSGRVCVVVDDVSTTGATLTEAERALYKAGARQVYQVALARS